MNDLSEELTAYIDGELSPERVQVMEAALQTDPALRALEQRLRQSIDAVEALPELQSASSPALRRAVLDAVGQPTWREKWLTWPKLMPLGLALTAAAVTVVVWPRPVDEDGGLDDEKLMLAQNLEVVEDLDLVGLDEAGDLDVVAQLHELEVTP